MKGVLSPVSESAGPRALGNWRSMQAEVLEILREAVKEEVALERGKASPRVINGSKVSKGSG